MKDTDLSVEQLLHMMAETRQRLYDVENSLTRRKKYEESLRHNEERYRIHFSLADDVMFSFDRSLKMMSVSPNVERVLGYKPEELIGKHFRDLNVLHPDDVHEAVDLAHYVLSSGFTTGVSMWFASGTYPSSIFRFITKSGERRFGELTGMPLMLGGHVAEAITVARDITKRIEIEQNLRETAENFQNVLKSLACPVFVIRKKDACLLYANDAFLKAVGYQAKEIQERPLTELNLFTDEASLADFFETISRDTAGNRVTRKLRTKSGDVFEAATSASAVQYGRESCIVVSMFEPASMHP